MELCPKLSDSEVISEKVSFGFLKLTTISESSIKSKVSMFNRLLVYKPCLSEGMFYKFLGWEARLLEKKRNFIAIAMVWHLVHYGVSKADNGTASVNHGDEVVYPKFLC